MEIGQDPRLEQHMSPVTPEAGPGCMSRPPATGQTGHPVLRPAETHRTGHLPQYHDETPASTFIQVPSWEGRWQGTPRRGQKQPMGGTDVDLTLPKTGSSVETD